MLLKQKDIQILKEIFKKNLLLLFKNFLAIFFYYKNVKLSHSQISFVLFLQYKIIYYNFFIIKY